MSPAPARAEEKIWLPKGQGSAATRALLSPLLPLSWAWALAMTWRRRAYQGGRLKKRRVQAKVIVAGNLTVGGAGKTPVAEWIAARLFQEGMRSAIISRGYKGTLAGPMVVSDGSGPLMGPEAAGDEPVLMAKRLKGVPVLAGKNRCETCRLAIREFKATHLVLDDGFQHLALERDMDVLVIDSNRDPAKEYTLPRGPLREPISAASFAHAIVMSNAPEQGARPWQWMETHCPGAPVFPMRYRTKGLTSLAGDRISRTGVPSLAFCGIGRPGGFFDALELSEAKVVDKVVFEDHHLYTENELKDLARRAEKAGAERLVTTEKDAVKIDPGWAGRMPVDVLRVEPDFGGQESRFFQRIMECVGEGDYAA